MPLWPISRNHRQHLNTDHSKDVSPMSNTEALNLSHKKTWLRWIGIIISLLILWFITVMVYQTQKPLPPGISYESPLYQTDDVKFWTDITYTGADGNPVHEQQIYKRIEQIIDESRQFLVIDMFLFNDYTHKDQQFPPVSSEITKRLIQHQKSHPEMEIIFITDEVNTNYNSAPNPLLESMKAAGISVVMTDVNPLRDSTPLYSAVWRTFFQWFGQSGKGTLPNLMADNGPAITVRSYLKLLNVKANHRKVVVSEKTALISSANIHAASAYHSNIAIEAGGEIIKDVLAAEQAAVNLSGGIKLPEYKTQQTNSKSASQKPLGIRYLTEGKIYSYVLESIQQAESGDVLWMGMFYLAEDKVMDELINAAKRGVDVRLILDPNQNAFGREKIGIPNRPAAAELLKRSENSIGIRWYNTGEEQYHTKLLYIAKPKDKSIIIGGSTNFTPRNLKDYNLENNLWVDVPKNHRLKKQLDDYFDKLWFNQGAEFTLDFSAYEEQTTWIKDIIFRLQKTLGFTTF